MSYSQGEDFFERLPVNLVHYDRWIEILLCQIGRFSWALKYGLKIIWHHFILFQNYKLYLQSWPEVEFLSKIPNCIFTGLPPPIIDLQFAKFDTNQVQHIFELRAVGMFHEHLWCKW